MKHRALRIAWSVTWGIVAVLLVVLWVRSYYSRDCALYKFGRPEVRFDTYIGVMRLRHNVFDDDAGEDGLTYYSLDPEVFSDIIHSEITSVYFPRVVEFAFDYSYFLVPYWFAVSTLAAIAGAPWLRWRFRLRTLLIATTLVAIGLGLVVWAVH